jgi:hypothetical protein
MFYVYLVHCALLHSLQVESIPKARVLCLCHKSLCTFFLSESLPILKFAGYVVLMAKRDAFQARVRILGEKKVFQLVSYYSAQMDICFTLLSV